MLLDQDNREIVSVSSIVEIVLRSNSNSVGIIVEGNHRWEILTLHHIQVHYWCVNVICVQIWQLVIYGLVDPQIKLRCNCSCKIRRRVI
jgi:hypothetical protein